MAGLSTNERNDCCLEAAPVRCRSIAPDHAWPGLFMAAVACRSKPKPAGFLAGKAGAGVLAVRREVEREKPRRNKGSDDGVGYS